MGKFSVEKNKEVFILAVDFFSQEVTLQISLIWVLYLKLIVGMKIESELVGLNYIISWISILHPHFGGGD